MIDWHKYPEETPAAYTECVCTDGTLLEMDLYLNVMFHKESHSVRKWTHWLSKKELLTYLGATSDRQVLKENLPA